MAQNPIAAVAPFDVAQAIVVEDFESFPVLHTERPLLTAIEQDGTDYCRVDPAFGFARNLPPTYARHVAVNSKHV